MPRACPAFPDAGIADGLRNGHSPGVESSGADAKLGYWLSRFKLRSVDRSGASIQNDAFCLEIGVLNAAKYQRETGRDS